MKMVIKGFTPENKTENKPSYNKSIYFYLDKALYIVKEQKKIKLGFQGNSETIEFESEEKADEQYKKILIAMQ